PARRAGWSSRTLAPMSARRRNRPPERSVPERSVDEAAEGREAVRRLLARADMGDGDGVQFAPGLLPIFQEALQPGEIRHMVEIAPDERCLLLRLIRRAVDDLGG